MHDDAPASPVREHVGAAGRETIWAIETEALELTWHRTASGEVRLTSLRTAGHEWIAASVPLFSFGDDPSAAATFRDVSARVDRNRLRLQGILAPSGLTVAIAWTVHEAASLVVAEIEVTNETDHAIELGSIASLQLAIVPDGAARLGVLAGGRWDEAMPPRGYQLQTFDLDQIAGTRSFGAADDGRSSGDHVPWFALITPNGGLLASLIWSGRWQFTVQKQSEAVWLRLGLSDFAHLLAPGERLALPGVVLSGYAGELDDGANAWRDWIVAHWMPAVPENWPWVQYNHWYAYFGDIDADRLSQEARYAAEVGCEVFVIDDGWFRGRRPESYAAGWGDWVEDRAKFPRGLHAFGAGPRQLGLKFGLWVEPERADQTGELVRAHPDWVATRQGEPIVRRAEAGIEGVHLCLGNPRVQRWMTAEMIRVVQEYGVDWLKWDYNIGYGLGCDADDHGHQTTDGHYAHTLGLYRVLDDLRTACPELVIENCASGGHRVDLGTLRHTHTNWLSDYTHRAASCRQHVQGAGLFLPLPHLNSWVLDDRDPAECRSRMGGAFGLSSRLGHWSDGERDRFRQAVAEYKRLRPFLAGRRFLLTGPLHQSWDIWQFVAPAGEDFALLAFRESGAVAEIRVTPRVRFPDRMHLVEPTGSSPGASVSGTELAADGLSIHLPDARGSEIIWVTTVR
ncbi:MAG: alpha-galactosidase [Chloroflexota bacterium]|nr:alpha-galactosidase [Chloroflexota bacterium]